MNDYIEREAAIKPLRRWQKIIAKNYGKNDEYVKCLEEAIDKVEAIPAADVCSIEVLKQVMWERDAALSQLAEVGKGLGAKMDDVRPVVKGHWELDENGMDWNIPAWVCSECGARNDALPVIVRFPDGEKTTYDPYRFSCSNFCPNCGAMMEES